MSPRPERRKSSLSGSSPIAPPPAPEPAPEPEPEKPAGTAPETAEAPRRQAPPAAEHSKTATASTSSGERKYRPKVSFYQDPEDTDRVRGAILHTMTTEGHRNLSQFIHYAVMAEVERLEKKYNDGKPFPNVGARELPQGRPMGE